MVDNEEFRNYVSSSIVQLQTWKKYGTEKQKNLANLVLNDPKKFEEFIKLKKERFDKLNKKNAEVIEETTQSTEIKKVGFFDRLLAFLT